MDKVLHKLRKLDAYPKVNEDFYSRTFSGGLITLVSFVLMLFLFFSELRLFLHTVSETKLVVDTSRGGTLHINFDVTFPAVPCSLLSLDAMDISGEQHLDIRHDIVKKRIDAHGNVIEVRQDGIGAPKVEKPLQRHGGRLEHNEEYCGSCYGSETSDDDCCNSCEEVREAYRKKGWALTNMDMIDQITHRINKLSFGHYFPGLINPLDGVQWVHENPNGAYQYFIKVVPAIFTDIRGRSIQSNQYSVTEHFRSADPGRSRSLAGVFFFYDISPVKVTFKEEHIPFLHFMTHICAIIGGIFTVAGIIDSFVYHGQRVVKKKM
ncbi:endoplasmic reticulum-Golgi intermediate compartment protein 3-like isoform X2 [Juglans microcarpa x Juglans regia]|uniref:endoplasmic reticulum-Golgi intermediate compartment protein 3-like isoform X2 n=1 Tax=Juglans microcarpa x Juglans regia TaxID=2249226 RepID=UPI001B7E5B6F|nr:endoplasmic reticulum-Golgi intermediate compartment protein 3-like isoform X2 [Juglans microcarpa x Juglans regia]